MQPRKTVLDIPPYSPGMRVPGKIKMASNENPLGMGPLAARAVADSIGELHIYPDGGAGELTRALGAATGLDPACIITGNGSDEVIFLAAAAYLNPGDTVLVADHTFSEYRFSSTLMDGRVHTVPMQDGFFDLEAFRAALDASTRIVFLCSPNNPTGTIIPFASFLAFMEQVPSDVLVLMDQAYAEFVDDPDYGDVVPLVHRFPNLLVTRTFSKLHGLAGLRLGYGMGNPGLISVLSRVKPPFNTSLAAQAAGVAALADHDFQERSKELNRTGRAWITARLEAMGLRPWHSQANFVCVETRRDARALFQVIMDGGVILRPCGSFGLPGCLRISVGTPEQNRLCMDLLEGALKTVPPLS